MQFLIAFSCGLVCLAAISAHPLTPEEKEKMKETMETCMESSGVADEDLENAKKGEALDKKELGCFVSCVMQAHGVMNADGDIDMDKAISHVPESVPKDKVTELMELCAKLEGADACEKAGNMAKCLYENKAKELFSMSE